MSRKPSILRRMTDWAVMTEGSTRSAALIRIGLVLLIWARWAGQLLLYNNMSVLGIALSLNFFISTTLMFFGIFSRFATAWTACVLLIMYYYFGFQLGNEPWTHHHTYLLTIGACLCALTPCGRSYSFDRWQAVRGAEQEGRPPPPERGNLWGVRLMALQLSLIYFWTAFDKTTPAFLSGERLEHIFMWHYLGSSYPGWFGFHVLMILIAWATVLMEYMLGIGLLFERTRWLVIPGLLLHGIFFMLLPVSTYSLTMWLLYLAYFNADSVHQFIDRLSGVKVESESLAGDQRAFISPAS